MCFNTLFNRLVFSYTVFSVVLDSALSSNSSQHEFLVVSLYGRNTSQFVAVQEDFQKLIASLTVTFCELNGFTDYGVINSSTVEVHNVTACSSDWPSTEFCVNVNFSVPVNSSENYELSTHHLYDLWRTCTDTDLGELRLTKYDIPSDSTVLILWLSVTGIMFLLFLLILVVVVKTKFVEIYIRQRRDVLGSSSRSWHNQHNTKQLVPPFFYPEPPTKKHLEAHQIQYVTNANGKQDMFGIENPGYDPDRVINIRPNFPFESQISHTSEMVDDFDSDDDTIYPPPSQASPQPAQQRNERGQDVALSKEELETAF